jgi:hypothetical protein
MGKFIDLTGLKFNKLTVIKRLENDKDKNAIFLCRCDCGNEVKASTNRIKNSCVKSCGCILKEKTNLIDLTNKRFGRLTVIKRAENIKPKITIWECHCDCGNKIIVIGSLLKKGHTRSCGCIKSEQLIKRNSKHGYSPRGAKNVLYNRWSGMKARCNNPHMDNYKFYGGRGIRVCERWEDFENFKNDMEKSFIEHVSEFGLKNTEIERINNNKGYSKDNCCWKTHFEQSQNTRKNKYISFNGKRYIISEFRRKFGDIFKYECTLIKNHGIEKASDILHLTKS